MIQSNQAGRTRLVAPVLQRKAAAVRHHLLRQTVKVHPTIKVHPIVKVHRVHKVLRALRQTIKIHRAAIIILIVKARHQIRTVSHRAQMRAIKIKAITKVHRVPANLAPIQEVKAVVPVRIKTPARTKVQVKVRAHLRTTRKDLALHPHQITPKDLIILTKDQAHHHHNHPITLKVPAPRLHQTTRKDPIIQIRVQAHLHHQAIHKVLDRLHLILIQAVLTNQHLHPVKVLIKAQVLHLRHHRAIKDRTKTKAPRRIKQLRLALCRHLVNAQKKVLLAIKTTVRNSIDA